MKGQVVTMTKRIYGFLKTEMNDESRSTIRLYFDSMLYYTED